MSSCSSTAPTNPSLNLGCSKPTIIKAETSLPNTSLSRITVYFLIIPRFSSFLILSITADTDNPTKSLISDAFDRELLIKALIIFTSILSIKNLNNSVLLYHITKIFQAFSYFYFKYFCIKDVLRKKTRELLLVITKIFLLLLHKYQY